MRDPADDTADDPWAPFPRWTLALALLGFLVGWFWISSGGDHWRWRIGMCSTAAILVAVRGFVHGKARLALSLALIVWSGTVLGAMVSRPATRLVEKGSISEWSYFHYYLGAKYFTELGYDGLYDQAVVADAEGANYFAKRAPLIRNLQTYEFEARAPETRTRRAAWTDARWAAFKEDLSVFYKPLRKRWAEVLTDRGYNATPPWNTTGWLLSQLPAGRAGFTAITVIDVSLLVLGFGLVVWAFGPLWGLMAAAWLMIWFGNQNHVIGRPFLHDYAAALAIFVVAVRKEWARVAAVTLAYAAMVRIFPGFFLGGLGLWSLLRWRATGSLPAFTRRFAPVFLLACALFVGYGSLNGRGPSAWTEFLGNISLHSEDHRFGGRRVGLQHFFTHKMTNPLHRRGDRRQNWEEQETLWRVSAGVMCLLWVAAMLRTRRSDPLDAMLLTMAVVFAVVVLSRYYWGVGGLFFLLGHRDRDGPWKALLSALLLLMIAVFYQVKHAIPDDTFPRYVVANAMWIGWFVLALTGRLLRRPEPLDEAEPA